MSKDQAYTTNDHSPEDDSEFKQIEVTLKAHTSRFQED
jgi:hypothetical protein